MREHMERHNCLRYFPKHDTVPGEESPAPLPLLYHLNYAKLLVSNATQYNVQYHASLIVDKQSIVSMYINLVQ